MLILLYGNIEKRIPHPELQNQDLIIQKCDKSTLPIIGQKAM